MGGLAAVSTGVVVGVDEAVIIRLGARGGRALCHAAALAAREVVGVNQAVIVIIVHHGVSFEGLLREVSCP
jgi:hypothetical protein